MAGTLSATTPRLAEPFAELPVFGVPPPDKKWILDAICAQMDAGYFSSAAQLADAMMRDDAIVSMLENRLGALFGKPLDLEPAVSGTAKARKVRDEIVEKWPMMFPRTELEEVARYGFMLGLDIFQHVWDTSSDWTFTIDPFHPRFYFYRWDLNAYQLTTFNKGLATVGRFTTVQWGVHAPYGFKRAYLMARIRSLMDPWMMRGWDKNDWANYLEIYGKPIRKAIMPEAATPSQQKEFLGAVANIGNNAAIKVRQDKDGNKYDVELLEAQSQGIDGFEKMMGWTDRAIARIGLGQSESQGQNTGEAGGLNRSANAGDKVALQTNQAQNSAVSSSIYQTLRMYCAIKYGDPDLAPTWNRDKRSGFYLVEPPEDLERATKIHLTQAQADATNISAGIYSPNEARQSRFGGESYSTETKISEGPAKTMQEMREAQDRALDAMGDKGNGRDDKGADDGKEEKGKQDTSRDSAKS